MNVDAYVDVDEDTAIRDEERSGVWIQDGYLDRGDGRLLSQTATDRLIARELMRRLRAKAERDPFSDAAEILAELEAHGIDESPVELHGTGYDDFVVPYEQRGGIHSDPFVRFRALREWGRRDRLWGIMDSRTEVFRDSGNGVVTFPWRATDRPIGTAVQIQTDRVSIKDAVTGDIYDVRLGVGMPTLTDIIRRGLNRDRQCTCARRCPFTGKRTSTDRCSEDQLRDFGVLPPAKPGG